MENQDSLDKLVADGAELEIISEVDQIFKKYTDNFTDFFIGNNLEKNEKIS